MAVVWAAGGTINNNNNKTIDTRTRVESGEGPAKVSNKMIGFRYSFHVSFVLCASVTTLTTD